MAANWAGRAAFAFLIEMLMDLKSMHYFYESHYYIGSTPSWICEKDPRHFQKNSDEPYDRQKSFKHVANVENSYLSD